ncbi:hypothetical protein B0H10DRAFT_2211430 [Mycena sp. CBHHK59/15]|nr:hypothetical protein B0H10DRAFT_2211430 [Mycena sp. CBHHK59/15]
MDEQDVDMTSQYEDCLAGPKSYNPPARGWTPEWVRTNHKDYVIKELDVHPDDCIAAVILTSDFMDRARGPGTIQAALVARGIPDSDKIDIFPPIPKQEAAPGDRGMGMPWTNIITNCTAAFKEAVLANPIYHAVHEDSPVSFYCFSAHPETPWTIAVYTGFTDTTLDHEFKSAFYCKLLADTDVVQMVREDHSNFSGDHPPAFILAAAIYHATVSTFPVHQSGKFGISTTKLAHSIMLPPLSKDPATNNRLQQHIMAPAFVIDAQKRGEGRPWLGGNPRFPQMMGCGECHGVDHYNDHCPILGSKEYREIHNIADDNAGSSTVPTSLSMAPVPAPLPSDWGTVNYRGGNRGRARGGSHGRDYNGGGYTRGNGRHRGNGFGRGNGYTPYY